MRALTRPITRPIGWISEICGGAAALCALGLIVVTLIEVMSRYFLRMPTVWAFDVAYMLNGAAFMLGCGLALKYDQHVRVDILSQAFSPRLRRAIEVVVFAVMVLPTLGLVCYAAWDDRRGRAGQRLAAGDLAVPVGDGDRPHGPVAPGTGPNPRRNAGTLRG